MSSAQRLLHDDDLVVYADASIEAVHAAFNRAYQVAKPRVASNEPHWTDEDGEMHFIRYRITFGEDREDLTVKQRGFLHAAVFPQIAEQVRVGGDRFVPAMWKEFYRSMFLGFRWESYRLPGQKRATPRKVRISTEGLSIKQYSEHIDKVIAHAVSEYGVTFIFEADQREEVRYRRPARRKPEASTAGSEVPEGETA